MKLKDVPFSPAYLVFHDAFDNGAMDVYPYEDFQLAKQIEEIRNKHLAEGGNDDAGHWRAYIKLPRVRVHKFWVIKRSQ